MAPEHLCPLLFLAWIPYPLPSFCCFLFSIGSKQSQCGLLDQNPGSLMSTILQLGIPYKAYLWQEGPQLNLNLDNLESFWKLNSSFNSRKFLLPTCMDTVTQRKTSNMWMHQICVCLCSKVETEITALETGWLTNPHADRSLSSHHRKEPGPRKTRRWGTVPLINNCGQTNLWHYPHSHLQTKQNPQPALPPDSRAWHTQILNKINLFCWPFVNIQGTMTVLLTPNHQKS